MKALMIAAPTSGAGKTTVTLGLMRALSREMRVAGAKSGPDYIDPQFHALATGQPSVNLDAWAMSPERLRSLASQQSGDMLIVEAAMGLFDGVGGTNNGSAADLARHLDIPILLILDAKGVAATLAAIAEGIVAHWPDLIFAGLFLNNVGSAKHEALLRQALARKSLPPVVGVLRRSTEISLPSRHLGLVQPQELDGMSEKIDVLADAIAESFDHSLLDLPSLAPHPHQTAVPPPGQTIAIARDAAFAFAYPHHLADWRQQGAELRFFSPLTNDPVPEADFIFLPGGYPELHATLLANNNRFLESLKSAAQTSEIYGECGGYMILGETLTDANGTKHPMAGLLPLATSFADRKLHLGYRTLTSTKAPFKGTWAGHEFHYATTLYAKAPPIFECQDAEGRGLPPAGQRVGRVSGSFMHLIEPRP